MVIKNMNIENTLFNGIEALNISNGTIQLTILTGVGPRIIHASLINKPNLFAVFDETFSQPLEGYRIFGGHRLWHAPEHPVRTYIPDNKPVNVKVDEAIHLTQATEEATGIQKQMSVQFIGQNRVRLTQHLTNHGIWPVRLAGWGISMMKPDGVGIFPLPPRAPHSDHTLLFNSRLNLWSYTDFSDPRYTFTPTAILLRQDRERPAQKFGGTIPTGWLGYAHADGLFIKYAPYQSTLSMNDEPVAEIYTDPRVMEIETLSATQTLAPSERLTHIEEWDILPPVDLPTDEAGVAEIMKNVNIIS
jgi:hypothetical protein